jgi:hypothetical protein
MKKISNFVNCLNQYIEKIKDSCSIVGLVIILKKDEFVASLS